MFQKGAHHPRPLCCDYAALLSCAHNIAQSSSIIHMIIPGLGKDSIDQSRHLCILQPKIFRRELNDAECMMSTHGRGSEMVFCFLSHWGTLRQIEQHHFRPIQNINSCKKKLVDHCWDWDFMLFHVSVKLAIDVDPFFSQHLFEMVRKWDPMRN